MPLKLKKNHPHFHNLSLLFSALKEGKSLHRKARQSMVLDAESGKKLYSALIKIEQKCKKEEEKLTSRLQFCIQIEGDFEEIV